ncbi:MAG TPA: YceI family protein [Saprospiraceae bacterium]|nr:YceI family protein [Saprospiraceae bacterium]
MSHKFFATAVFLFAAIFSVPANAQKLFTRDGVITFDATAPNSPESIKAVNKSGTCVWDKSSGAVEMAVLIKGFLFERSLMQEHFNENYLESTKYPKATFTGKLDNPGSVDTGKDGTYKVNASGTLTMHGVSKTVAAPVTFTVKGGKVSAAVNFSVALADYSISIPSVVADKVNKKADIGIAANLELMK